LAMENVMPNSIKSVLCACLWGLLVVTAACTPRRAPPMTVAELMDDRVTLDGLLIKCDQDQVKARADTDCLNARVATERLASRSEAAEEAKRTEEFERSREKLRMAEDRQRQEQESKTKVDAYHLPVVPVDAPPGSAPLPQDPK